MKLSDRLMTIADMIPNGSHVIDVGCDHGLLTIFLAMEKNCSCLATDINAKALSNARLNINKYKASNIELMVTDGLQNITLNIDDYIVIAGMGTTTVKHILSQSNLSNHLIISSNNQLFELRQYVTKLGYYIVDEKYVVDHQKSYVIIHFDKGKRNYSKLDLKYGPIVRHDLNYLIYELNKLVEIKNKLYGSSFNTRYQNNRQIRKLNKLIQKEKGK